VGGDLLVFRVGQRLCGLAVEHVDETMRPLPIEPFPDAPPTVRGISIIRAEPTPIVDLRRLLEGEATDEPRRLITLRVPAAGPGVPSRRVGLLVDSVLGVRDSRSLADHPLPPLVRGPGVEGGGAQAVEAIARLDAQLMTVLRAAFLVPDLPSPPAPKVEPGRVAPAAGSQGEAR